MNRERKKTLVTDEQMPPRAGQTRAARGPTIPMGADVVTIERSGLCARFFFVVPKAGMGFNLGAETCELQ